MYAASRGICRQRPTAFHATNYANLKPKLITGPIPKSELQLIKIALNPL